MKKKKLERLLKMNGWQKTEGSKHDKWVKGNETEMIPRHSEIDEELAKTIIKRRNLR